MSYDETLVAERATWLIEDEAERAEKLQRERIRHHKLIRDLLLDKLDTQVMDVLEVGGGPLPVSDLIPFKSRLVVDPLSDSYAQIAPCPNHVTMRIETYTATDCVDLVIATNSLDHVERPRMALRVIAAALRPGGYAAIMCAENNALTHPHPAHVHNITARTVHDELDRDFETVWELNYAEHGYRYGWVSYQGRRGQPAFALLMRRCTGF